MEPSSHTSPPRTRLLANALGKGVSLWYPGVKDTINSMRMSVYTSEHLLEGTVFPAMTAAVSMQEDVASSLVDAVRGEQTYREFAGDWYARVRAGARFNKLVKTFGRELFGSARFEGETVLVEDEFFRLTYIPPKAGVPVQTPMFHAGGCIPYGDRIFRLLPEATLYRPFLDRGMPVYAMELKGDRYEINYGGLDIAHLIDAVQRLSDKAFEHAGRKMVFEGYCGHGMQALAYLAAMPEDAARKLAAIALFVSPVHGPDCTLISALPQITPRHVNGAQLAIWKLASGYVPGDSLRFGLDLALKKNFIKTPFGRFYDGWCQSDLSHVGAIEELTPAQRKSLAGAYWISPQNAKRFPITVDLVRYANAMFSKGLTRDGTLPFSWKGEPLSLQGFIKRTDIPVVGFYGGTDPVIIDRTAYPLMRLLGSRYKHVVHPNAGHISYIFSAEHWDPNNPKGFRPNPIDEILALTATSIEVN